MTAYTGLLFLIITASFLESTFLAILEKFLFASDMENRLLGSMHSIASFLFFSEKMQ